MIVDMAPNLMVETYKFDNSRFLFLGRCSLWKKLAIEGGPKAVTNHPTDALVKVIDRYSKVGQTSIETVVGG